MPDTDVERDAQTTTATAPQDGPEAGPSNAAELKDDDRRSLEDLLDQYDPPAEWESGAEFDADDEEDGEDGEATAEAGEDEPESTDDVDPIELLSDGELAAARSAGFTIPQLRDELEQRGEATRRTLSRLARMAEDRGEPKAQSEQRTEEPAFDIKAAAKKVGQAIDSGEDPTEALAEAIQGAVKADREKIERWEQSQSEQQQRAIAAQREREAERFFASVDDGDVLYGKGDTGQVPKKLQQRRSEVFQLANVIQAGVKALYKQEAPFDKALPIAHKAIASQHADEAAKGKMKRQLDARNKRKSAPPGGRTQETAGGKVRIDHQTEVDAGKLRDVDKMLKQFAGSK